MTGNNRVCILNLISMILDVYAIGICYQGKRRDN